MKKKKKAAPKRKTSPMVVRHFENPERWKWNIVIGIPSRGQVHMKWSLACWGMIMPMNFSMSRLVHPVGVLNPLYYHVAEAQNVIVAETLKSNLNWDYLLLLEDDVIPPGDLLLRLRRWVEQDRYPMVSGLYHLKHSAPRDPMIFRGRGNGAFKGWREEFDNGTWVVNKTWPDQVSKRAKLPPAVKPGEVVFADGVPTGCLLISTKLLRVAWNDSKDLILKRKRDDGTYGDVLCKNVFETVREAGIDPETGGAYMKAGTSDLEFCDRILANGWLAKAGYKEAARMKYPFPVDLTLQCGHIDTATGRVF